MAEVTVEVGGRHYPVTCRDGDEHHVRLIAGLVDAKARDAERAVGGVNEIRQLLLASLLLADELNDARQGIAPPPPPPGASEDLAPALDALAARIESLAARLEQDAARP